MQADSTPFVLGMQDVDGQLRDFQDKQNIDIGLIMGRNSNSVSTVSERMPVFSRATIMRMGTARSLSVSEFLLWSWLLSSGLFVTCTLSRLRQLNCISLYLCLQQLALQHCTAGCIRGQDTRRAFSSTRPCMQQCALFANSASTSMHAALTCPEAPNIRS